MKNGVAPTKMAEILDVGQQTVNEDILWISRELLQLGLRIGDWVEIKLTHSNAFWLNGKFGRIVQVCLSGGEVGVDLNPLSDSPREQLFEIRDVRKLNEMEVLAKVAQ